MKEKMLGKLQRLSAAVREYTAKNAPPWGVEEEVQVLPDGTVRVELQAGWWLVCSSEAPYFWVEEEQKSRPPTPQELTSGVRRVVTWAREWQDMCGLLAEAANRALWLLTD